MYHVPSRSQAQTVSGNNFEHDEPGILHFTLNSHNHGTYFRVKQEVEA